MNIIDTLNEKQIKQLQQLYQLEWWTKGRSLEETRKCLKGSQISFGLVDKDDDLIGFARVITDFVFKAFIFDVIVRQDYRKSGLGKKLLSLIQEHPKLSDVRHFELYCLPELAGYYEQLGFTTDIGGIVLMRYLHNKN